MRVVILGSWRDEDKSEWRLSGTADGYASACRELGRALARRGHIVIGGGKSATTADYHVVQGILDVAPELSVTYPLIEVIRPANDDVAYGEATERHPELFQWRNPTEPNWGDAHMLAISEADVVISLGGAGGTYREGLAVLRLSQKRLIPVASFGGASARLIEKLSGTKNLSEYGKLYGRWTEHTLQTVLVMAELSQSPYPVTDRMDPRRISSHAHTGEPGTPADVRLALFISHSSHDASFVQAIIELVRSALGLAPDLIRCTSVDGYRLPAGADIKDHLRIEIHHALTFVGVISADSLNSAFVMFELGARWGAGKHLVPVLTPGTNASVMKGPLADLNALRGDNAAQLHQFVHDLARELRVQVAHPAAYQLQLERVLAHS